MASQRQSHEGQKRKRPAIGKITRGLPSERCNETAPPELLRGIEEFNRGEFFTQLSLDRLDDVYFPRHGELVTLQWNAPRESLGADDDSDD